MHVALTGQIRHDRCLITLLGRLASAKRLGVIQSVSFAYWRSQSDLVAKLHGEAGGVVDRLIAVDEPAVLSPGHFYHQMRGLDAALAGLPDDDFVLRLRPDIFVEQDFLPWIAGHLPASGASFWTPYADLSTPYFGCDIVFGGTVRALKSQTNYSAEPYLNPLPPQPRLGTKAIFNHDPEVQRWLHPGHRDDWRTHAYWTLFPSFGIGTTARPALLAAYRRWDFYLEIKRRWLTYLCEDVSLGGLREGTRIGLLRPTDPHANDAQLNWLQGFDEFENPGSEAALEHELRGYNWTSDNGKVERVRDEMAAQAPPTRPLTPREAYDELKLIWEGAMNARESWLAGGLTAPFKTSRAVYQS